MKCQDPHEILPKEERQNPPKWIDTYINLLNQSSYFYVHHITSYYMFILEVIYVEQNHHITLVTLWLFNVAMENHYFLMGKSTINCHFQ